MSRLNRYCIVFLLSVIGLSSCHADSPPTPQTYEYGFDTGGFGGKGWGIWVEYLIIDERLRVPVGTLSGGPADFTERLPGGKSSMFGALPLPKTVRVRWFSYRLQKFYEATVEIPPEHLATIAEWFDRYPRNKYTHHLITGLGGNGQLKLWWEAACIGFGCPQDYFETHELGLTPLLDATLAEGDITRYRVHSRNDVRNGDLPEDVAYQLVYPYGLDITNTSNTLMIAEPIIVTSDTMDLETGADTGTITYQSEQKLDLLQPSPQNPPNNEPAFSSAAPQLMRLPHTVHVEWLNLITQTAYTKTINITQTQREQLFNWIVQYTEKRYSHTLTASVGDTGQVQLWWQIQCRNKADCPETDTEGHSFELTPDTQADESWQNTEKHLEVIQALVASGQLPDGVLKLIPETETP